MCSMPMKKAEARHLFNLYDVDNSGSISFKEFVEGVMENTCSKFGSAAGRSTASGSVHLTSSSAQRSRVQFPRNGRSNDAILGADAYTLTLMEMKHKISPSPTSSTSFASSRSLVQR